MNSFISLKKIWHKNIIMYGIYKAKTNPHNSQDPLEVLY